MSEEEIIYPNVRFHKSSSQLRNVGRPDETQGPREAGHRKYSISWHLIEIPLGILIFILLVAVAVLVHHIVQYRQENHELQKSLSNLDQECSTKQNDSYLWEEKLRNNSIECNVLQDDLDSLNRILTTCSLQRNVLDCQRPTGKVFEGNMFCCGIKCYYLTKDKKTWSNCNQTCQDYKLSFLKIDDDDELKFIQLQMNHENHWVGLSFDIKKEGKWQWSDGQPSKLDPGITNVNHRTRKCAFLSKTKLHYDDCGKRYSCICEK